MTDQITREYLKRIITKGIDANAKDKEQEAFEAKVQSLKDERERISGEWLSLSKHMTKNAPAMSKIDKRLQEITAELQALGVTNG